MTFGDDATARRVLDDDDPAVAKRLGRGVRGFDTARWEAVRFGIVVLGSTLKFTQHEALRAYLLSTGDAVLVEASPVDRIWGVGLAADDHRVTTPAAWRGLNLLGFALMEARATLAERER